MWLLPKVVVWEHLAILNGFRSAEPDETHAKVPKELAGVISEALFVII